MEDQLIKILIITIIVLPIIVLPIAIKMRIKFNKNLNKIMEQMIEKNEKK